MKKFRSYIAGILTGALLFSLPVVADSVKEMIEVYFNTVTVTVDGKKVEADNILYNGRTYVPLRAISEITGKTVKRKNNTRNGAIKTYNSQFCFIVFKLFLNFILFLLTSNIL